MLNKLKEYKRHITSYDGKKELVPGHRVVFQQGFFETSEPELIDLLEKRADFGTAFVRVPENKTTEQMHAAMKSSEEKDKEIARLKAELDTANKKLSDQEGGAETTGADDLEGMQRPKLIEVAEGLGLPPETWKVGTKNEDIKVAIREARAKGGDASFEE